MLVWWHDRGSRTKVRLTIEGPRENGRSPRHTECLPGGRSSTLERCLDVVLADVTVHGAVIEEIGR